MAKGARASTKKANNVKLKSNVFGPVETDRTARLSAKLLALASQPKPKPVQKDVIMETADEAEEDASLTPETKQSEEMEVDEDATKIQTSSKASKGRIEKRRSASRSSSIVFPKYKNRVRAGKSKSKGKK